MPLPARVIQDVNFTPSMIRDQLMAAAGMTPEVQARILKRAVNTALRKLRAQKTIVATHNGIITDTRRADDNMAQLRAAELLTTILGAAPSKDSNGTVKVTVDVRLPDWAKPAEIHTIAGEVSDAEIVEKPPTSE